MKLLSLTVLSLLLALSLLAANPHDPKGAKITRNEAQHIALKRYPGGRVITAKLETVQGILVWSIEISPSNAPSVTVAVDARTGRVDPATTGTR
jgi:uncharacterized membrane protein YkoI